MLPGKSREEYEVVLGNSLKQLKRNRKKTDKIKRNLYKSNKVLEGNIQMIINNPDTQLPETDWRILVLLGQQVSRALGNHRVSPEHYYTENELKKAQQYSGVLYIEDEISLPLTLEEVIQVDYDIYLAVIDVKTLAQLSSLLLNYNFDIQREPQKRIVGGETIKEATLIMKNVQEIKENLLKGTQEVTNIVINASLGTSDEGDELIYDSKNNTLTITKGTRLDIVDGYHRCKASELAVNENPDIDFKFGVLLLNYTDDQAAKYQGQLAKATPITKSRQKQLSEDRYADIIVNNISSRSELSGRITNNKRPNIQKNELVSYDVLADSIDKYFSVNRNYEVHRVSEYLIEFFDYLIGYYDEQFLINPIKYRRETLMLENNMFAGYVLLASRMFEEDKQVHLVTKIIGKIDFSRDNSMWKELGVIDNKGNLNDKRHTQKGIEQLFNNIDL